MVDDECRLDFDYWKLGEGVTIQSLSSITVDNGSL